MEAIQVSINPEQVNKMVAEAILKSTIGENLEREINEQVKKFSCSWDSPFKKVVAEQIKMLTVQILVRDHQDKIRKQLAEIISAQMTDALIENLAKAAMATINDGK